MRIGESLQKGRVSTIESQAQYTIRLMKSDKQRSARAPGDPALASTLVSAEEQQDSAATTIPDAQALVKLGGPGPKSARPIPIVVKEVPVGTLFGNFEVVRKVGQGGMGVVYEARHRTIGRKAAIKVMHREWTQNPEYTQRFLNEARAVNIIQHPGLIEIFEYGQQPDGTLFIVMEFLDGESLEQRMHKQGLPLSEQAVVDIAIQLARALTAAHEKGVIHRDLKPEIVSPIDKRGKTSPLRLKAGGIHSAVASRGLNESGAHGYGCGLSVPKMRAIMRFRGGEV